MDRLQNASTGSLRGSGLNSPTKKKPVLTQRSNADRALVSSRQQQKQQKQRQQVQPLQYQHNDIISFDCGGEIVPIQKSVILKNVPNSFLAMYVRQDDEERRCRASSNAEHDEDDDGGNHHQNSSLPALDRDKDGNILLDRDPRLFRTVVNFCRGYRNVGPLSDDEMRALLQEADAWCIPELHTLVARHLEANSGVVFSSFYTPHHQSSFSYTSAKTEEDHHHSVQVNSSVMHSVSQPGRNSGNSQQQQQQEQQQQHDGERKNGEEGLLDFSKQEQQHSVIPPHMRFVRGPGVNGERNRVRNSFTVGIVGDRDTGAPMVAGVHCLHLEVQRCEYVGFGIMQDPAGAAILPQDQEFHRMPGSVGYYYTGVFYSNCPTPYKEEKLGTFAAGSVLQMRLDMEDKVLEFFVDGRWERLQSVACVGRARFAVVMKLDSAVRIISPERAAHLVALQRQKAQKVAEELEARRLQEEHEQEEERQQALQEEEEMQQQRQNNLNLAEFGARQLPVGFQQQGDRLNQQTQELQQQQQHAHLPSQLPRRRARGATAELTVGNRTGRGAFEARSQVLNEFLSSGNEESAQEHQQQQQQQQQQNDDRQPQQEQEEEEEEEDGDHQPAMSVSRSRTRPLPDDGDNSEEQQQDYPHPETLLQQQQQQQWNEDRRQQALLQVRQRHDEQSRQTNETMRMVFPQINNGNYNGNGSVSNVTAGTNSVDRRLGSNDPFISTATSISRSLSRRADSADPQQQQQGQGSHPQQQHFLASTSQQLQQIEFVGPLGQRIPGGGPMLVSVPRPGSRSPAAIFPPPNNSNTSGGGSSGTADTSSAGGLSQQLSSQHQHQQQRRAARSSSRNNNTQQQQGNNSAVDARGRSAGGESQQQPVRGAGAPPRRAGAPSRNRTTGAVSPAGSTQEGTGGGSRSLGTQLQSTQTQQQQRQPSTGNGTSVGNGQQQQPRQVPTTISPSPEPTTQFL